MEFLYCEGASNLQPSVKDFDIAENTVIEKGDIVSFNNKGLIQKHDMSLPNPLGVAVESHNAETIRFGRKTKIKVNITPNAVYKMELPTIKFLEGSTSTSLKFRDRAAGYGDYCFYDRHFMLVSKSDKSENTDEIGTMRKVSYALENNEYAVYQVEEGGVPHPDDVYVVIPNIGDRNIFPNDKNIAYFRDNDESGLLCVGVTLDFNGDKKLPYCHMKFLKTFFTSQNSY